MDPEPYALWNVKLRTIRGPGFAHDSNFLVLSPHSPNHLMIGFNPQKETSPFESIIDPNRLLRSNLPKGESR